MFLCVVNNDFLSKLLPNCRKRRMVSRSLKSLLIDRAKCCFDWNGKRKSAFESRLKVFGLKLIIEAEETLRLIDDRERPLTYKLTLYAFCSLVNVLLMSETFGWFLDFLTISGGEC